MDAVEEVKSRLAIEDIVGEYVELKRAGRNYKGLSPFNAERTPSFMVSPEKGIWHDFSSGKGGNVFSFIMEVEGLDFKGALELLARKAGVDLSQYRTGRSAETGKLKERLYEALETATKFYQVQFSHSQKALEYVFKQRQFTKDTALEFRLGYAPNTGSALMDYMQKQGFTAEELQKAGLTAKRYRGPGDMFRGRLMIPLQDATGRVVGFTARLLDDDPEAPKYINTPQTLLYDKGRHVYGLHLAKDAIRKASYAVLVEGNLDVIASHQAGVRQVVATAGTALTEMHLKAMNRFTGDIRLAFDQDKAGLAAMERAIPIASKVGVTLSVITIPEGKDPDELVRKDPKLWEAAVSQHQYALDWIIDKYQSQLDLDTAAGKREFSDITIEIVRQLPDSVEQEHYLKVIADILGVSKDALKTKLVQGASKPRKIVKKTKVQTEDEPKDTVNYRKDQNLFTALMLYQPALRYHLKGMTMDMFPDAAAQTVIEFLEDNPNFAGDQQELLFFFESQEGQRDESMQNLRDYVKILGLQFEELYKVDELLELRNEATRLKTRLIKQYVEMQKQPLIAAMNDATDKEQAKLLEQVRTLDELLKTI